MNSTLLVAWRASTILTSACCELCGFVTWTFVSILSKNLSFAHSHTNTLTDGSEPPRTVRTLRHVDRRSRGLIHHCGGPSAPPEPHPPHMLHRCACLIKCMKGEPTNWNISKKTKKSQYFVLSLSNVFLYVLKEVRAAPSVFYKDWHYCHRNHKRVTSPTPRNPLFTLCMLTRD